MFHHGYIFQTMVAEAGPLSDEKVQEHRTMQLLYGVNRDFKVRLEGKWHKSRLCLLDSGVPHYINGEGDWQLCFYIYPDSHTGQFLKSSLLKDSSASLLFRKPRVTGLDVKLSVVRPVSPFDLARFFEQILYLLTGRQAYLRPNQFFLEELIRHIAEAEVFSVSDLARLCGMERKKLTDKFEKMTGFSLETWLLHQRMMNFFNKLDRLDNATDDQIDSLSRETGISGIDGLDRLFNDLFGIPYTKWTAMTVGSVILTDRRPEFPYFT